MSSENTCIPRASEWENAHEENIIEKITKKISVILEEYRIVTKIYLYYIIIYNYAVIIYVYKYEIKKIFKQFRGKKSNVYDIFKHICTNIYVYVCLYCNYLSFLYHESDK